jgi:hypothetical protein
VFKEMARARMKKVVHTGMESIVLVPTGLQQPKLTRHLNTVSNSRLTLQGLFL